MMSVSEKMYFFDRLLEEGLKNPLYSSGDELHFRCPICNHKLAEHLEGLATFYCRKCKQNIVVDRRTVPMVA